MTPGGGAPLTLENELQSCGILACSTVRKRIPRVRGCNPWSADWVVSIRTTKPGTPVWHVRYQPWRRPHPIAHHEAVSLSYGRPA